MFKRRQRKKNIKIDLMYENVKREEVKRKIKFLKEER